MGISQDPGLQNALIKWKMEMETAKIVAKGAAATSRMHSSFGAYGSFWPLELTLNHIGGHLLPL
jgi:hypothetical protein